MINTLQWKNQREISLFIYYADIKIHPVEEYWLKSSYTIKLKKVKYKQGKLKHIYEYIYLHILDE